jgi:hypothetical protein
VDERTAPSGTGTHGEAPGEAYRRLLLPAGAVWVEARRWRLSELAPAGDGPLLWGERHVPRTVGTVGVVRRALARESTLVALRLGAGRGGRDLQVRRLAANGPVGGSVGRGLARQLRRGTVVELTDGPAVDRPLEQVLRTAGLGPGGALTVGAGGGLLLRARGADGRRGILRVGLQDDVSDPAPAADALELLASRPDVRAPELLDRGSIGSVTWSFETVLPGTSCTVLTSEVWAAVVAAWRGLPRGGGPPRATSTDLRQLATWLPQHGGQLASLRRDADEAADGRVGVLAHRDLWPGNLLVDQGMLSGVIDWGSWRPDALPGVDLLQLFAGAQRRQRREPLGRTWLRRPWSEGAFRAASEPYWDALGIAPDAGYLETVGIAWWAAEVAGTLERIPERRRDARWHAANVAPVLDAISPR